MFSPSESTARERPAPQAEVHCRSQLRGRLLRSLPDDPSLDAFCLDYFPDVAIRFSAAMDRTAKLNLLLTIHSVDDVVSALYKCETERMEKTRLLDIGQTGIFRPYEKERNTLPLKKRTSKKAIQKLKLILLGGIIFDYLRKLWNFLVKLSGSSPAATVCSILLIGTAVAGTSTFGYLKYNNNSRLDDYRSGNSSTLNIEVEAVRLIQKLSSFLSHILNNEYDPSQTDSEATSWRKPIITVPQLAKAFVPKRLQIQKISGDCKLDHILITSGRSVYQCSADNLVCLRAGIPGTTQFEASAIWLASRGRIPYSNTSALRLDRKNGQAIGYIRATQDPRCSVNFVLQGK